MLTNFLRERARVAVLTRHRDTADPELLEARRRMGEEALVLAVGHAVAKAPPITNDVRLRLLNLLRIAKGGTD